MIEESGSPLHFINNNPTPPRNILKSGWLQGESYLVNKVGIAEVKLGKGRMVLLPLRVQHRAQPYGTFKPLFNAILTSAGS